jgi:osmotically-inducible protein OsmY
MAARSKPRKGRLGTHMAERIQRALRASGYTDLHAVAATVVDGTVILQGEDSSYFIKQIAQETVRPALGARKLVNGLRVIKSNNDLRI